MGYLIRGGLAKIALIVGREHSFAKAAASRALLMILARIS
jgi:hypothetical protein